MSENVAAPDAATRRPTRRLWTALVVSLALNLLLVGLIAGAAAFRYRWGGPIEAGGTTFGFLRSLPRERREEIRQANRERLAAIRPLWRAAGEARREADRLLTVEPFDVERFMAAHQRVIEVEAEARKAGSRILAETAARLSAQERQAMLHWRDRPGRKWRDRGAGNGSPKEIDPPDQVPAPQKP